MNFTPSEKDLCRMLRYLPATFNYRYTKEARTQLQSILFRFLVDSNQQWLVELFDGNIPFFEEEWILREAQNLVDGFEYTAGARGKPCGHIFKNGEATYKCKTCTHDDTCVLCSRCFEASDHTGHMVSINISPGNSGCCDCGDEEAWVLPVNCAIHSTGGLHALGKQKAPSPLPESLKRSMNMTIGRALDYLCDVISCSPEQLRLPKSVQSIIADEKASRLKSKWYDPAEEDSDDIEYALILWNDEKHTVHEVENQVARACRKTREFGLEKARETDAHGRSVLKYSKDIEYLLEVAKVIEQIKITITIRSARDTFREQMCSTIIDWLLDISGCRIGDDYNALKETVCREMLQAWRTGSEASNAGVGRDGIDDHEMEEDDFRAPPSPVVLNTMTGGNVTVTILAAAMVAMNGPRATNDAGEEDEEEDVEDDEAFSRTGDEQDLMELDTEPPTTENVRDQDMRTNGELGDDLEVREATLAGYPPPPPPPHPTVQQRLPVQQIDTRRQPSTHLDVEEQSNSGTALSVDKTAVLAIPKTPAIVPLKGPPRAAPSYWTERPNVVKQAQVPLAEDLNRRVRLDWMILYDLRLWKQARIGLRDLYITTVVTVPEFKRILGLRFAGLYTVLAQLYLIADREPDLSIIYLSLQMLTTPSITQEVVEKGNFLTNLIAILYTFLTSRQVAHPWDIIPNATLAFDAGSVTNRRMYHFFMDLKHLFHLEYIQERFRQEERYALQFLDLIQLPQGICPNVRAMGEHVEYETDAWIGASLLTREINKLCRQFAESFAWRRGEDVMITARMIRVICRTTILHSIGAERKRFDQAEVKADIRFKEMREFEARLGMDVPGIDNHLQVVDFVVEKEPMSFHHALHYTLSWLIDGAKSLSALELRRLLHFTMEDIQKTNPPLSPRSTILHLDPESYLMALFDYPLRVCVWLAQMKASMWVRNGHSLRHQMITYRGTVQRDLAHQRDIFLLQTALVICNPTRVLLSIIDRFGMSDWMSGHHNIIRRGYEELQQLEVAEEFISLLITLLCDRTALHALEDEPHPAELAIRREIGHILCFKPLPYTDLTGRLAEKFQELEEFQAILEEMTHYRSPEGLTDFGTFELKENYLADIDPYVAHYTKNQREEAENIYKEWVSRKTGRLKEEIAFEPKIRTIKSGVFKDLSAFTGTLLFAQVVFYSLDFVFYKEENPSLITRTKADVILQVVLHLILAAIVADVSEEDESDISSRESFVSHMLRNIWPTEKSIFVHLHRLLLDQSYNAHHPKVRLIFLRAQQKRPLLFKRTQMRTGITLESLGTDSPARLTEDIREAKKKEALSRQAKVLAQFQKQQEEFISSQSHGEWEGLEDDEEEDELMTGEEEGIVWRFPGRSCLLCQEETNNSGICGTFALLMQSTVQRQTDLEDPVWVEEVVLTPESLDRSADHIRPFGVSGWNREIVTKLTSTGEHTTAERQGLGKGFPTSKYAHGALSTSCGHMMHYKCFEEYINATARRQAHQIARNHPETLGRKEFVCPLCKALGNTFLPIIWKSTEERYPGVVQSKESFDVWLQSSFGMEVRELYDPARESKSELWEMPPRSSRQYQYFRETIEGTTIAPTALQVDEIVDAYGDRDANQPPKDQMPGHFPAGDSPSLLAFEELYRIYLRIVEAIRTNHIASRFEYSASQIESLGLSDVLSKTLAGSIIAVESSLRGVESNGGTIFVSSISDPVIIHLRVLSATVSSYIAVGGLRRSEPNAMDTEVTDTVGRQTICLFSGHPSLDTAKPWAKSLVEMPAVLGQDTFTFLVECSVFSVPVLGLDIHHVLQACYLAELVKVTIAIGRNPAALSPRPSTWASKEDLEALRTFMGTLLRCDELSQEMVLAPDDVLQGLYKMLSSYALTFLRKVAILLHVRYGVDFSGISRSDVDEPELMRLTNALRLPSMKEMFELASTSSSEPDTAEIIRQMIVAWVSHWKWTLGVKHLKLGALRGFQPSHPAIYELIGLPRYYDTLLDEVMRRRCPTTGRELVEPALCLFCGKIFCSQAVCCSYENMGGCNQHMRKCGRNVGIFLSLRKCMILYLHGSNGAWINAPYLDRHGEVDPNLRKTRPLMLSQKRYDGVQRAAWLNHGIPNTISRKLEVDINTGGWDTL